MLRGGGSGTLPGMKLRRCPVCRARHFGACPVLLPLLLDPEARRVAEALLEAPRAARRRRWLALPQPRAAA
jgi:hypothetical protein